MAVVFALHGPFLLPMSSPMTGKSPWRLVGLPLFLQWQKWYNKEVRSFPCLLPAPSLSRIFPRSTCPSKT